MKPWIKSWTNILDKPKVMRLPPGEYKFWSLLLHVAGRVDRGGLIPPLDEVAFILHVRLTELQEAVTYLIGAKLIDETPEGYRMHDWDDWNPPRSQYPSDDNEQVRQRVAESRARRKGDVTSVTNVTSRNESLQSVTNQENCNDSNELKIRSETDQIRSEENRHTASGDADGAPAPRVVAEYPAQFERVYGAYPRKGKKKAALDRWKAIRPNEALVAAMLAAIERLSGGRKWREGYVEYFDTWLKNQGWEDPVDDGIARSPGKVVHLRPPAPVFEGFDAVYADVVSEIGRWRPGEDVPRFTPSGDAAIAALGGWEVVARAGIVRAEFYEAYGAAIDRRAEG
jgi:hypothetical protein